MSDKTYRMKFSDAMMPTIDSTIDLIKELHEGQTDHSGKPYANHPQRVAQNLQRIFPQASGNMVMAALLHDTIEDCDIDEGFLQQKGYSEGCIAMVALVTKPKNDKRSYDQVIDDLIASDNMGAMLVKLADNMDNLHPQRVADLTKRDPEKAERLGDRYRIAIDKLSAALSFDKDHINDLIQGTKPLNNNQNQTAIGTRP